jgi:hypothetical protein
MGVVVWRCLRTSISGCRPPAPPVVEVLELHQRVRAGPGVAGVDLRVGDLRRGVPLKRAASTGRRALIGELVARRRPGAPPSSGRWMTCPIRALPLRVSETAEDYGFHQRPYRIEGFAAAGLTGGGCRRPARRP